MELWEALNSIIEDVEKFNSEKTLFSLNNEDQETFKEFINQVSETEKAMIASRRTLITLGFVIGHNFVEKYWALW